MVNGMCVYEVQFYNRFSGIPEKWPRTKYFHNFYILVLNQSTFGGECVHIDHSSSEEVETILA